MKLSIIVCVYNTPKEYLRACFESITTSTLLKYKGEYEICMVDDGSEIDYTDLICEFGVNAIKTENGGIFSARMNGIEIASGDYIAYCDADDTVSANYYLPMLETAMNEDVDIVINDWAYHTGELKYFCKNDYTIKNDLDLKGDEVLRAFLSQRGRHHAFFVLWNKLFRSETLKSAVVKINAIDYPTTSSYGEDALINFFAWQEAKYVKNVHSGYYFYRIHDSQVVNATSEEKLKKQVYYMTRTLDAIGESLRNHIHASELCDYLDSWRTLSARAHYSKAKENKYTDLYDYIKAEYGVIKNEGVRKKDSRAYFAKTLIGDNFDEVDQIIRSLYNSDEVKNVRSYNDRYTKKCVELLLREGKITKDKNKAPDTIIPKLKSSLKHKLTYNPVIYKLGLIFLGKDTKLRRLLKKHI